MFVLFLQNTHTFYGNVTKLLCAGKLNTRAKYRKAAARFKKVRFAHLYSALALINAFSA